MKAMHADQEHTACVPDATRVLARLGLLGLLVRLGLGLVADHSLCARTAVAANPTFLPKSLKPLQKIETFGRDRNPFFSCDGCG